jgi:hypothetical protein
LLQLDGKMYLIEEEWDTWRKKHEVENHSSDGTIGDDMGKDGRRTSPPTTSGDILPLIKDVQSHQDYHGASLQK